jgi:ferrous iron transport protein A
MAFQIIGYYLKLNFIFNSCMLNTGGFSWSSRVMSFFQNSQATAGAPAGIKSATASLDRLPAGVPARVYAVSGSGAVARRLMEMGVVPGAPVSVIKSAPLGDPLEVRVRNYHLALRRSEAQTILVVISDE